MPSFPDGDAAIRSTDDDAAHARVSAVRKCYLKDPYIQYLVPRSHLIPSRPPLINVGTYVRSEAIDKLIFKWLELLGESSQAQIDLPVKTRISKYAEIDFAEIISKKALSIRKHSVLNQAVGPTISIEKGGTVLRSEVFNMFTADLRGEPSKALQPLEALLSSEQPVLLLSECVIISYDMFGLGDAFGKVMRENLQIRNIELPGADDDPTMASLKRRLHDSGLPIAHSITLKNARAACFSELELQRISELEKLDELEELDLVLSHYALTWGSNDENEATVKWQLT
ncbi:carboxy methyl transferase for protein phosphatase 2A [Tulasnella sp. UAMH 9824]|nr:carboxy methyl transferase for protein phosphatase 2A [Tulasnella sp. UAMH 9824]